MTCVWFRVLYGSSDFLIQWASISTSESYSFSASRPCRASVHYFFTILKLLQDSDHLHRLWSCILAQVFHLFYLAHLECNCRLFVIVKESHSLRCAPVRHKLVISWVPCLAWCFGVPLYLVVCWLPHHYTRMMNILRRVRSSNYFMHFFSVVQAFHWNLFESEL